MGDDHQESKRQKTVEDAEAPAAAAAAASAADVDAEAGAGGNGEDPDLYADELVQEFILESPRQKSNQGVRVPLALRWKGPGSVEVVAHWLHLHQAWIESRLAIHGAVLFRGFPLASAGDFNQFVCAFEGWQDLSYQDSLSYAARLHVVGRVCTTNEGKNGGIVFHHEQAQTPRWPTKLFFYCENPATEGGGTGVCPSDVIYRELADKFPDFIKECENGVHYTAYLKAEPDPSKGAGRGWKSFFGKQTKEEVEARMRELGYSWEWMPQDEGEDVLKSTSPLLPAVREAPGSGRKVFFNQMVAMIANALEFADRVDGDGKKELNMDRFMTFAEGRSVDPEILKYAKDLCEKHAVELAWQKGDVALLDNYLVMHARRVYEGPRRVLASLVK